MSKVIPYTGAVVTEQTIEIITCGECGVVFGIGTNFQKERRKSHATFYCPNGHSRYYPEDNKEEELRKELERQKHWREQDRNAYNREYERRKKAERERAAARGQVTKVKNRVKNGVCPCCNRSFKNLRDHMSTQHPNYVKP